MSARAKPVKFDPIEAVRQQYTNAGWIIGPAANGAPQQLIAHKTSSGKIKMHFIRVIFGEAPSSADTSVFVQNAVVNGAIPVHATVVQKATKSDGMRTKIMLEDKNTATAIVMRQKTVHEEEKSVPA